MVSVTPPAIAFLTPQANRRAHLMRTLPHNLAVCRGLPVAFVVCHMGDHQGTADWQRKEHPQTVCIEAAGDVFNYARACNIAARHAAAPVVCTLDADQLLTADYVSDLMAAFLDGADCIVHEHDAGVENNEAAGRIALRRDTFLRLGGYDERFTGWGGVDTELVNRCVDRVGLVNRGRRKGPCPLISHGDDIRQKSPEVWALSRALFDDARRRGLTVANPDHPWGQVQDRCIPSHDGWGFNAGVLRLHDGWLVADRYQTTEKRWAVMLRRFDAAWNETRRETPEELIGAEDMRLVLDTGKQVVRAFGTWAAPASAIRQVVAAIDPGTLAVVDRQVVAADFPMQVAEKNWAPFQHAGRWFVSYGLRPHLVLELDMARGLCRRRYVSLAPDFAWAWGEPRGGTPWLHLGADGMLCCWHSMLTAAQMDAFDPVRHARERKDKYYFAALALAEAKPPFRILGISREPLGVEDGIRQVHTVRSASVTFPMALLRGDAGNVVLAYGEHDQRTRMVSIPWERIKASLRPVATAPAPFGEVRCA